MKKTTALLLFSGGLDSMIAAKVLQNQNIDVTGISFSSFFFDTAQAEKSAEQIGLPLITKNFSKDHLRLVQNPKNFTGKGLNPCIDCHALMLKVAAQIAKEKNFDIIVTGEVLGQRPLSQTKPSLLKVEKEAGLPGKVLRPLSAKLLPKTVYEEEKLVDREKLLDISGRSRKKQIELAEDFGIDEFPTPAGGCLLTETEFSKKLEKLLSNQEKHNPGDFKLIKIGGHHWIEINTTIDTTMDTTKNVHLIFGRNKEENDLIEKQVQGKDLMIKRKDTLGPTALVRCDRTLSKEERKDMIKRCQKIIWQKSKKKAGDKDWTELEYITK